MHLPSNVGRYDDVPLPEFDGLEPRYIKPDASRKLRSWPKAIEVERRLDAFEWLVHVARRPQGIASFVLDLSTAYLLSFESAIQVLAEEKRFPNGVDGWLAARPDNDLLFRGLRTLRHLEAHIRPGSLAQRRVGGHSRFTGGEGGSNIGWQWSAVPLTDFRSLKHSKIVEAELPDLNRLLEERLIMDLMREGLERLTNIFAEAEKWFLMPA
jgi:hypothetical protein